MKLTNTGLSILALVSLSLPACHMQAEGQQHEEHGTIVVTSPKVEDVVTTQQFVCQIHSRRHIEIRALERGYLKEVNFKEGQAVKKGDVLFKIMPILYKAEYDAAQAEAKFAQVELDNAEMLYKQKVVSIQEVALFRAKLAKAKAKAKLAEAHLNFSTIRAPFDGIVHRQYQQLGALVEERDVLTTLSDNSVMWVYFNVPEAFYLDYMTKKKNNHSADNETIELLLANGSKFPYKGKIAAIEGQFNNETGNIPFRADFPNPDGLLRHGQTGTVLIQQTLHNAIVIPQRATFEILDKQYVFVVDDEDVVHQREIGIQTELDDIFVINRGLAPNEKFVLEGIRQVHDGEKIEYEWIKPEEALKHLKFHAE